MMLTDLGWIVVHSSWQGLVIAGLAALALSLVREPRADRRYLVAGAALVAMAIVPLVTAWSGMNATRSKFNPQRLEAISGVIDWPTIVWWGSVIVPVIGALWIAGVAWGLWRIAREGARAAALRRQQLEDAGDQVHGVLEDLRRQMRPDVSVAVRASARATVPMVLGWRRPIILLPSGTASRLRLDQLRAILAHELAHVRRRDYLANLFQIAAETLLFHHPAARWLSRQIRAEREYCCDDAAVRVAGDAVAYARTLAALEDARTDCRLAVAAGSGTLLDRIQRIVGHPRRVLTPMRGVAALLAASILAAAMYAVVMTIPPSLPFGTEMRRRVPPPNGVVPAGVGEKVRSEKTEVRSGR
jgi:beta-lactamase regulating signal transducer with metallopeptidase domain